MSDLAAFEVNCRTFTVFFILGLNAVIAANATANCSLLPVDESLHRTIEEKLKDKETYLIQYKLKFPQQRSNPLVNNFRYVYKPDSFNRVRQRHGQTLLSLAFNYGVISLMTLTFGTSDSEANVYESPANCLSGLSEDEALNVVLYLLARDFDSRNQTVRIHDEERICLRYIVGSKGIAYFKPRCYSSDTVASMTDSDGIGNKWIDGLYILLSIVKVALLGFGPLLFVRYVATLSQESVPYIVKLKEPLLRTLFVAKNLSDFEKVRGDRILNLSKCRGYPKLKQTLENSPFGRPFLAMISEYDILAANSRLILENEVPVTFWSALAEAIFRCKVKNVRSMHSCCYADMFSNFSSVKQRIPWINFWTKVGNALLILFLPFLYYLRLFLFYVFESEEVVERKAAARRLNLKDSFENSLLLYFTPTHPLFIAIYFIYFVSAFVLAYLTRSDEGRFRNIVVGSFADLRRLSYLRVFEIMVQNIIWPFKRYGILGCVVAIVYWPVVLPPTFVVYVFYSIPSIYLTIRMLFYSRRAFLEQIRTRSGVRKYQMSTKVDNSLDLFQVDFLFGDKDAAQQQPMKVSEIQEEVDDLEKFRTTGESTKTKPDDDDVMSMASSVRHVLRIRPSIFLRHLLASVMCIVSLYSLLIIVAECLGALVEIGVFTLMGIIVNAGLTVKYAGLVLLIIVYTYDCFNNIQVRYFKLNKVLFAELKSRVKGLDNVTSLPSYLQENQAFKSQEQSEQGAHETPDDIAEQPSRHWLINDLVLFVDNEDNFRIPRRLFKLVCQIRVAGVPGPIYEGIVEACYHFLKMLTFVIFVFLVVLSFGDIYELSGTTQMLAVLASGFLPIVMRQFMEPRKPDIEINSLSFRSKLDEVIKNFWQLWPVHDFSFTPKPPPPQPPPSVVAPATPTTTRQTTADLADTKVAEKQVAENDVAENKEDMKQTEKLDEAAMTIDGASVVASADTGSTETAVEKSNRNRISGNKAKYSFTEAVKLDMTQEGTIYHVDLLIRLPSKYEDQWVDGWSNIIEYKEVKKKHASEVAENMATAAAVVKAEHPDNSPSNTYQ